MHERMTVQPDEDDGMRGKEREHRRIPSWRHRG
jgi:hypothetical protein